MIGEHSLLGDTSNQLEYIRFPYCCSFLCFNWARPAPADAAFASPLQVLKVLKAFPALAVIVNAMIVGMSSIGYIGLMLFITFYVFAI